MVLIGLKWRSSSCFPNLMVQMFLSEIQQVPGPNLRKAGKSLDQMHYFLPETLKHKGMHTVECQHQNFTGGMSRRDEENVSNKHYKRSRADQ